MIRRIRYKISSYRQRRRDRKWMKTATIHEIMIERNRRRTEWMRWQAMRDD